VTEIEGKEFPTISGTLVGKVEVTATQLVVSQVGISKDIWKGCASHNFENVCIYCFVSFCKPYKDLYSN
jgi:hypothetical protein